MFRINDRVEIVSAETIQRLGRLSVPAIGDALGRFGCVHSSIKPLSDAMRLSGPALTVQTYRADNLMCHVALEMAHPGDVLVVDACGFRDTGLWGALMTAMAKKKSLGGLVMDGGVRDKLEIIAMDFPVFSAGISPMGGFKDSPGSVNVPIACGGVSVSPGDIVVGDADGVVVVPAAMADLIAESAEAVAHKESLLLQKIHDGESLFDLLELPPVAERLNLSSFRRYKA